MDGKVHPCGRRGARGAIYEVRWMNFRNLFSCCLLAASPLAWSHPTPATIPAAPDTSIPAQATQATPKSQATSHNAVTIFEAKKIITLDPMQPEATAVAVQDGHILAVGNLEEVQSWVHDSPVEVDRRFAQQILLPGFIEAHMHPHITGILWQGLYVGRFDRYTPDGKFQKGLTSKQQALDKIAAAAKELGDNDKWVIAWGYQPEFYNNQPLTVTDLDPITGKHPILIENASMHIYYVNSLALKLGGITPADKIPGVIVKDGKLTGEFEEADAVKRLLPQLPPVNDKLLLTATWNSAKLAHQVGVTSIGDASFGMIPGSYKAYADAAADPNFPVRLTLYPLIEAVRSPLIEKKGGLAYIKQLMKANTDRLSIGSIKFVTDGSIQGMTANLLWPYYHETGKNGVANMSYAELEEWVTKVHQAGLQCMIHSNGDQATEWAIQAIQHAQDVQPRLDHRHHLDHNQMVNDNQLQRMATLGIATNLFINHIHFWGDLHRKIIGPQRSARMNPLKSALRHGVHFSTHSDSSVTRLDPLFSIWVAATRKTMSGQVLGPQERISVEEGLKMVTLEAAYLMHQDNVKGSVTQGKLADLVVLAENPLEVAVDHVKDIKVVATIMDGKVFPVNYK